MKATCTRATETRDGVQRFEQDVMRTAAQLAQLHNLRVIIPCYKRDTPVPPRTNSVKPTSYDENQPVECEQNAGALEGAFVNPAYTEAVQEQAESLVEYAIQSLPSCPRALRRPAADSWQLPEMQSAGELTVDSPLTTAHTRRFTQLQDQVRKAVA